MNTKRIISLVDRFQDSKSLLKRCLKGTYIAVEPEHLHRYVGEEAHRFNTREMSDAERFMDVVSNGRDKRLTYKQLIGA